ncbi:DNA-methyltransferase [Psychrobacter sp. FDAARGOS_221]|uniref:DNA-methyltransferase n=1 Tax=Psychrobacter sp. FDAARGOS_221 TaxID=1975705 RepID=UPI000BB54364|nr:site-specific DNA-methyltransferase [Psychrobacter sp. FDAARGOS_221]PNK60621.1 site-specific DNA-methyltransferase [Psychrobacter sp. FDAARGOS_221]
MPLPYFQSSNKDFTLYQDDCLSALDNLQQPLNMVFADPPYFLSNDGLTVKNGKIQSVNKGQWDKFTTDDETYAFTYDWLAKTRDKMADNGTIWISGTHHNIFTLGRILPQLGFKILNVITWEKTNPPPNFSCRFFTHSTEFIIWARKHPKVPHYFNYKLMKQLNNDKQMKDVWRLPAIAKWEKSCGKHPTQKPLALLAQIILASTEKGDLILDPFTGSSTTGIAANVLERNFIGIDKESEFMKLSQDRYQDLQQEGRKQFFKEQFNRLLNKSM